MTMIVPKDLIKAIQEDKLVLFVGAGASVRFGFPNWKNLIMSILIDIDDFKLNSYVDKLKSVDSTELMFEILDKIDENGYKRYALQKLENATLLENESNLEFHKKLIDLSSKIITTNYDLAFEKTDSTLKVIFYNSEYSLIEFGSRFIFKIHGSITQPEKCILFRSDYKKLYTNNKENLAVFRLKELLINNTILFIGFSLQDIYIRNTLDSVFQMLEGFNRINYIISKEYIRDYEPKIKTLIIDSYEQIDPLIDELISYKSIHPPFKPFNHEEPNKTNVKYYKKLKSFYTENGILGDNKLSLDKMYISPDSYETGNLLLSHKNWINNHSDNRVRILLGYPGQGKTSFCYRLMSDLIDSNFNTERPLYFFKLRYINNVKAFFNDPISSIKSEIKKYKYEDSNGETIEAFINENTFKNAILILDGLDELQMVSGGKYNISDIDDLLVRLNMQVDSDKSPYRILLTSRVNYVINMKGVSQIPFMYLNQQIKWLKKYNMHATNKALITENDLKFVNESIGNKAQKELLDQPILLHLIARVGIDFEQSVNKTKLYENLFNNLINRFWDTTQFNWTDKGDISPLLKHFYQNKSQLKILLQNLAIKMYYKGRDYLHKSEVLDVLRDFGIENIDAFKGNEDTAFRVLLISFYFTANDNFAVEFLHKSLGEYLASERIFSVLEELLTKETDREKIILGLNEQFPAYLTSDQINYISDIIINSYKGNHKDLITLEVAMSRWINSLLDCNFFIEKSFENRPNSLLRKALNSFYGFMSIYIRLKPDQATSTFTYLLNLVNNDIGINFRNSRLNNYNLSRVKLNKAYFDKTEANNILINNSNIIGSSFINSDFNSANFNGTTLLNCHFDSNNFSRALFNDTDFTGSEIIDCDFTESNLLMAKFNNVAFKKCTFNRVIFGNNNFSGSILDGHNLSGSDMSNSIFRNASLKDCDFSKCKLTDSNFEGANMFNSNFEGSDFSGANLSYTNFHNSILKNATLKGAKINGSIFFNTILDGANFDETQIIDFSNNNIKLKEEKINNISVRSSKYTNITVRGINIENSPLNNTTFIESHFVNLKLINLILENAEFQECSLINVSITNTNLNKTKFRGVKFNKTIFDNNSQNQLFNIIDIRLASCQLIESKLSQYLFSDYQISNTVFYRSTLNGSVFSRGNLLDFELNRCDIIGCSFISSEIKDINFINTDIDGVIFKDCNVNLVSFNKESKLKNNSNSDKIIKKPSIRNSQFTNSTYLSCNFSNCDFSDAIIVSTKFINCTFDGAILSRLDLQSVNFENCSFKYTTMKDIDFKSTFVQACDFTGVDFNSVKSLSLKHLEKALTLYLTSNIPSEILKKLSLRNPILFLSEDQKKERLKIENEKR